MAYGGDVLVDDTTSITEQQRLDLAEKDYLFKLPGADAVFGPWSDLRARLAERHGFKPGASVTHLYQSASDTIGAEDDAAGYEFVVDGTWAFLGRDTGSPTVLGSSSCNATSRATCRPWRCSPRSARSTRRRSPSAK